MYAVTHSKTSFFLSRLRARTIIIGALLSVSVCSPVFAESSELNAKLAIARAQANIDLVSRENPAATQAPTFARAQQKLLGAQEAVAHNRDREAVWLANESELLADTTAGEAKLAGLEQTRRAVSHDVDVLQLEISNSRK